MPVRALGVVVVGMSVAVWWPAFQLGAWKEIFFDQLMAVWAGATGAFLVVMFYGPFRRRLRWWSLALLVPSLYIVLSFVVPEESSDIATFIVALIGVLVSILGIPFTVWVLIRLIWPELGEEMPTRARLLVIGIVAVVAVASFFLGVFQNHFLTCEDYIISGNSTPPGCVHAPVDPSAD